MDVEACWELFAELAAAVGEAVRGADDTRRRAAGERAGQYRLDLDADAIVVPRLIAAGFGVLSEESGEHHGDREVLVVVDPVDGSTNASRGLPCWATSLCALDAEGPWAAVVVDHSRGVTYRAARGRGATRQEAGVAGGAPVPISVAAPMALADAVIAVNGDDGHRPRSAQFRALGAAAVEICLVAEGALDGYVNLDGDSHGPWDYLGALLVLREAGGVAADVGGRDLVARGHGDRRQIVVASGEALRTAMMHR